MNINEVYDILINEIKINVWDKLFQFDDNEIKEFYIKFIGDENYLIKRIKGIKYIESIDSINVDENQLILTKGKNKVIFN